MSGAYVEVDLEAFRHNVATLSSMVLPSRTMLAVKANAYGHGMLPLALAALESGADSLAVLDVPAGLALRRAGVTAQLFAWLHGPHTDFERATEADIDLGISSFWELEAVTGAWRGKPARVHLKVDTGLHRNGARPEDWPELVRAAVAEQRRGRVEIVAIWSHLADASAEDDAKALAKFHKAVSAAAKEGCTPPLLHLAASSAGIREPEARLGLVRFGIAAYGISPFDDESGRELGLIPAMTVRAPVTSVTGGLATLPIGSGDGIQPPAVGEAFVAIKGKRYRIARLTIDSIEIESKGAAIEVGDIATIFGPGESGEATAEEWAIWAGTIGDEIVARAGERLPRVYLG